MGKDLASCPASPQGWGWPGTEACRMPPIQILCFWLRVPKYCPKHRVGAGRQAWGLGSACDLVWDKGSGEDRRGFGWAWPGVGWQEDGVSRVGHASSWGVATDRPMITPGQGVGYLFTFWYLLLSVVAVKLTLGTSGLGGHSHPGEPEARPPSSRIPSLWSASFWSGQGQRLGWTKQKT